MEETQKDSLVLLIFFLCLILIMASFSILPGLVFSSGEEVRIQRQLRLLYPESARYIDWMHLEDPNFDFAQVREDEGIFYFTSYEKGQSLKFILRIKAKDVSLRPAVFPSAQNRLAFAEALEQYTALFSGEILPKSPAEEKVFSLLGQARLLIEQKESE